MDDDQDDPQWDDVDDHNDDENVALPEMICPYCRAVVTEDTQKCPACGDWITPAEPSAGRAKRLVFVVAVLLMVAAMAMLTIR